MAISEQAVKFKQESMERGQAVPGQSLTNSPDEKYQWEKAPEFTNPRETMLYVFETLTVPETTENILLSLNKGVSVIDIASITLYSGFIEGKWNPDLMMILMEPTMYMVMALAEKANIKYILEAGDNDDEELDAETENKIYSDGIASLQEIKKQAVSKVNPQTVPEEIKKMIEEKNIEPSLLERIGNEKPTSLLGKGEQ
jgi:hypothetical protein|tara:strand:+ start:148 stop:744 length:597 start_codon:yes stop_codon:yes gene_type:complete